MNKDNIWDKHPEFRKRYDKIHAFCQSNSFTEDDSWEMMDSFEDGNFEKLQRELSDREDEIRGLLKAIDFTYDYLEKLIKEEKSKEDAIYNNTNVNRVNEMISNLADNKSTFYIDVNELFDDENGSLSTKYSSDSFHVYGKYYQVWVDWLCTKGIKK